MGKTIIKNNADRRSSVLTQAIFLTLFLILTAVIFAESLMTGDQTLKQSKAAFAIIQKITGYTDPAGQTEVTNPVPDYIKITDVNKQKTYAAGTRCKFAVQSYPEHSDNLKNPIWKSDSPEVAVFDDGTLICLSAGSAKITCTTNEEGYSHLSDSVIITVTDEPVDDWLFEVADRKGVALTALNARFGAAHSVSFAYPIKLLCDRDIPHGVAFSSGDPAVATAEKQPDGTYSVNTHGSGETSITATAGILSGQRTVEVQYTFRVSVDADPDGGVLPASSITGNFRAQMAAGSVETLSLTVEPESAVNCQKQLVYYSDDPSVLKITASAGNVTVKALRSGTAKIFARSFANPDIIFTSEVSVSDVPIDEIRLTGALERLAVNAQTQVAPFFGDYYRLPKGKVAYSVSDSSIATVDDNGIITARNAGKVTVKATLKSDPSISYSYTFRVVNTLYTLVRKGIGHFSLFLVTGITAYIVFVLFTKKKAFGWSAAIGAGVYLAVLSEVFQLKAINTGRFFALTDIVIDLAGYFCGILIAFIFAGLGKLIAKQLRKKRTIKRFSSYRYEKQ